MQVYVEQVKNLDLAHNWYWVSSLGQIGKFNFFNSSYRLIQACKKKPSILYQKFKMKHLLKDNLIFFMILYFILEHFTVLKQYFGHISLIEANSHFEICRVLEYVVLL